jgi:DMSO/TMAO reductase YedYZ molybdopterin-dependent catalytic subunit
MMRMKRKRPRINTRLLNRWAANLGCQAAWPHGVADMRFLALILCLACLFAACAGEAEKPLLEISGDVGSPQKISLADLKGLPQSEFTAAPDDSSSARITYQGVLLSHILQKAAPHPKARVVVFICRDGLSARLPMEYVMEDRLLIAHSRDGRPLITGSGGPLKAVPDSLVGYKWVALDGLKKLVIIKKSHLDS